MPILLLWIIFVALSFVLSCFSQEREIDDVVDSDFDIDENDEPASDQEEDEKRKRQVGTKAYKVSS